MIAILDMKPVAGKRPATESGQAIVTRFPFAAACIPEITRLLDSHKAIAADSARILREEPLRLRPDMVAITATVFGVCSGILALREWASDRPVDHSRIANLIGLRPIEKTGDPGVDTLIDRLNLSIILSAGLAARVTAVTGGIRTV